MQHIRLLLVSQEYKENFATGIMTSDNYYYAYDDRLPLKQMDENITKKCKDFDDNLSGLVHTEFQPPTG